MKLSPGEQDSIVALLTRIYQDIREIELEHKLLAGEGDFRPRIEYFHDAVRALSGRDPREREEGGRLSIELLAYDISCLRYLAAKPLSSFKPHGDSLSASTELVAVDQTPVKKPKRPGRVVRERLSELYRQYGVLFAAILKTMADNDFYARSDDLNHDVKDIHGVLAEIEAFLKGKGATEAIVSAVQHLENDQLREELLAFLHAGKIRKKEEAQTVLSELKAQKTRRDRELAALEAAYTRYVMNQLAIFEESRDMLKAMAGKGMNLVGKFVEAAIAESGQGRGR